MVKIAPGSTKLTAAKLATVAPKVGAVTVAIGSPFGLSGTVTSGVVSAVDRPLDNAANVSVNMIQTDAADQPRQLGRRRSPNINGEVIGVNAEILSQSGDNNGIGFAIPIRPDVGGQQDHLRPVAGQAGTSACRSRTTRAAQIGAYVAKVNAGSPAAKAGLQAGGRDRRHRRPLGHDVGRLRRPGDRPTAPARRPSSRCTAATRRSP